MLLGLMEAAADRASQRGPLIGLLLLSLLCIHAGCQIAFFPEEEAAEASNACVTPDGLRGECVNLVRCRPLLALLKRPIPPKIVQLLRDSVCAFKGRIPDVCCPRSRKVHTLTTRRPDVVKSTTAETLRKTTAVGETTTIGTKSQNQEDTTTEAPVTPTTTTTATTTTATTPPPPVTVAKLSECGDSENSNFFKIVGGEEAPKHAFPWIAAIGYTDTENVTSFLCGGSLISRRHVLTAAHCVVRDDLSTVRLGEHDLADDSEVDPSPMDYRVVDRIMHSGYSPRTFDHDIALLVLDRDVEYTETIRPICLPLLLEAAEKRDYTGTQPLVAGWGALEFRGPTSNTLQYVALEVISNSECKERFREVGNVKITEGKLCTYDFFESTDACQGDSGGPLMNNLGVTGDGIALDKPRWFLLGLVSFGYKCADRYPGVYARVSEYSDWIVDNLNEPYVNAFPL